MWSCGVLPWLSALAGLNSCGWIWLTLTSNSGVPKNEDLDLRGEASGQLKVVYQEWARQRSGVKHEDSEQRVREQPTPKHSRTHESQTP